MAKRTSSHSYITSSPLGTSFEEPSMSFITILSNFIPHSFPFSSKRNSLGLVLSRIGIPSSIASSISQSDAFILLKGLLTVTFTSFAPSLTAERQQSIAVLPPPITRTFLPISLVCSKAILVSQSIPI